MATPWILMTGVLVALAVVAHVGLCRVRSRLDASAAGLERATAALTQVGGDTERITTAVRNISVQRPHLTRRLLRPFAGALVTAARRAVVRRLLG